IHARAVLVRLHIASWAAKRGCKEAARLVESSFGAKTGSATARKDTLPEDRSSYVALMQALGEIRQWHRAHTLAWGDADGWRLLTTKQFTDYTTWMRTHLAQADALADAFAKDYPRLKRLAKQALNGWFRETDYPEEGSMRGRFSVDISYA